MDPTSNDGDGYGGSNGEEGGDRRRGFSGKQRMRGTPPLLQKYNRFSCLEVEEYEDTSDQEEPAVPKSEERMEVKMKKWEKKLPSTYVLAVTPGSNSFKPWIPRRLRQRRHSWTAEPPGCLSIAGLWK